MKMPDEKCGSADYHLAGMFLKAHMDYIIERVKEDIDG